MAASPDRASGLTVGASIHTAGEQLVEHLLERGLISATQAERGRRAAQANGERIDVVLNKLGLISDAALAQAYHDATGYPLADIAAAGSAGFVPAGIEPIFLRNAQILPLHEDGDLVLAAIADPLDLRGIKALSSKLGKPISVSIMPRSGLDGAIQKLLAIDQERSIDSLSPGLEVNSDDIERLKDLASEAPVIRLVSDMIDDAVQQGASDIHMTRSQEGGRVRFRLDGRLTDVRTLAPGVHQAVVSRLKIMASLDIGERRLPQDGRIQVAIKGREVDLRISTMPHLHGEGAFIRILDNKAALLDLRGLGFTDDHSRRIESILKHAHGLFLITGPTGSGKTTTLYAALRQLNDSSKNIVTVEDPIEYTLTGVNQIQVNRRAELDFPRALRSVLRQDPDVIMVGEIRDRETAAIAVQAALTGHFVLATLHTNDALSAVDRLIDMGVEPFLLSSVMRGAMAQRLVRRLCLKCNADGSRGRPESSPGSCSGCGGAGHAGRMPLAEVIPFGSAIQQAISDSRTVHELVAIARGLGFESLQVEGDRLVAAGFCSRTELLRTLGE